MMNIAQTVFFLSYVCKSLNLYQINWMIIYDDSFYRFPNESGIKDAI